MTCIEDGVLIDEFFEDDLVAFDLLVGFVFELFNFVL